jgi:aryl-alcohol dehydrogenase-like predicted oxidoreductase
LKLALGTVQFGLPYGVANQLGQIDKDESFEILEYAKANGIDTLDTAISYGESEQRLGQVGVETWQVISKLPVIPESCQDISSWVEESVVGSLERLKISKLSGLLMHQPQQLLGNQGNEIFTALNKLKGQGKVDKIGVSIYSPADLDDLWPKFKFDIVQAPYSIFDRRMATSGWMKTLNKAGTEVHVRSVFLQGLLLMDSVKRPKIFERWKSLWDRWDTWLEEQNLTALEACLGFTLANPDISRVLVGIDSLTQLKEIIAASNSHNITVPDSLVTQDVQLLNPVNWLKQ